MKTTRNINLGSFPLGHEHVRLIAVPGDSGGSLYFSGDDKPTAAIHVGLDHKLWRDCVEVLFHEAFELATIREGCRHSPCNQRTGDHANYLFNLTHTQFTQVAASVAWFVTPALPELASAWRNREGKRIVKKVLTFYRTRPL